MFPAAKPCPKPAMGAWVGFQVEPSAEIDLDGAEVRGFQGLIRSVPADPSQLSTQDTSDRFVVRLTTAADPVNAHPLGDVGAIRAVLDARIASLGIDPRRTFAMRLDGGGVGVTTSGYEFAPTDVDVQAIMGVVLARARAQDTMGVYDDPAWGGAPIVMTVNGVPV